MRVHAEQEGIRTVFRLVPEPGDLDRVPIAARGWYGGPRRSSERGTMRLIRHRAQFDLPAGVRLAEIHPDVLALASAFLVLPFVGHRLHVPRPVSAKFGSDFTDVTGLALAPVDTTLRPNIPPRGNRIGLAFSGGIDSTAAAVVLAPDVALVHLVRTRSSIRQWHGYQPWAPIRPDAGLHTCREMAARGHEVLVAASDMEYLTIPMGRPTIQAIAIPVLLVSRALGLDAVAIGTSLESLHGMVGGRFRDPSDLWQRVFKLYDAAGLSFVPAGIGLPEVARAKLVIAAGLGGIVRSCVRGTLEPCGRCLKCFRKGLVVAALQGRELDDRSVAAMLRSPAVIRELTTRPIHLENVYAWLCTKYGARSQGMRALGRLVGQGQTGWNERSYRVDVDRLPAPYATRIRDRTRRFVEPMSAADETALRSWHARTADTTSLRLTEELRAALYADRRLHVWLAVRERLGRVWRRVRRID